MRRSSDRVGLQILFASRPNGSQHSEKDVFCSWQVIQRQDATLNGDDPPVNFGAPIRHMSVLLAEQYNN